MALITFLVVVFAASGALAREKLPEMIQFSIQEPDGKFFYEGEVEFCTSSGECLFADIQPGFPGHFFLPSSELKPGVPYTVFVYDPQVTVLFEMRGWVFNPPDYDPGYNSYWKLNQFLIFPGFQANAEKRLTFQLETSLNPDWKAVAGMGNNDEDAENLPDWPGFLTSIEVPVMIGGNFKGDETAAGGVSNVKLGLGLSCTWRANYPHRVPERFSTVHFREFSLTYGQNRYGTLGVYYPGRSGEVTFHRFFCSYGFGGMNQVMQNHWSVSGALGIGGIYDGSTVLRYLDRRYLMFGMGLQARFTRGILATERLRIGLTGRLEWMYYPAAHGDGDYWFGSAPAAMLGFTVY